MSRVFESISPELWLTCSPECYATSQRFSLICIFGRPFPGFWLAIVWSLLFLSYTLKRKTRFSRKELSKTFMLKTPEPTSEAIHDPKWYDIWIIPAVLTTLAVGFCLTSYLTSAMGWRWMIIGAPALPPSAIGMSSAMGIVYLFTHLSAIDGRSIHRIAPLVQLKVFLTTGFEASGQLMAVQTALYLSMLCLPGVRWCLRSILFSVISSFGMFD